MDFETVPNSSALRAMKREAQKLLKPSAIDLEWRLTEQNHGEEAFPALVLVKFRGRCRAERWLEAPAVSRSPVLTLGTTAVDEGRVLPYIEVECDQVRKALATLDPAISEFERQDALGVAMGRVLAHEIYHVLARTTGHAAEGMARAVHPLGDLVNRRTMTFLRGDTDAIRNGVFAK